MGSPPPVNALISHTEKETMKVSRPLLLQLSLVTALSSASVIFPGGGRIAAESRTSTLNLECVPIDQCVPYADLIEDIAEDEQVFGGNSLNETAAFDFCEIDNATTTSDVNLGVLCPTSDEDLGVPATSSEQEEEEECDCVVIGDCDEVLDLIRNRFFDILNSSYKMCGFQGLTPKFCCPRGDTPISIVDRLRNGLKE